METIRLTLNNIEEHNKKIEDLLGQSFQLSFPQVIINKSSITERIESLKQYINEEKAIVYGTIINGSLGGFVWFFIKESLNSNRIHINHIVVDQNIRGKGIGKVLLDKVENYAIERNISDVELMVTKKNDNAIKFYENKNFEVERLVMKKRLL